MQYNITIRVEDTDPKVSALSMFSSSSLKKSHADRMSEGIVKILNKIGNEEHLYFTLLETKLMEERHDN